MTELRRVIRFAWPLVLGLTAQAIFLLGYHEPERWILCVFGLADGFMAGAIVRTIEISRANDRRAELLETLDKYLRRTVRAHQN